MKTSLGPRMLIYPTPTLVVGSYDAAGAPNAMTAAWGGVCCSKPPCVTVSLRKATYTHGNIMARRAYTLHIADESLLVATDFVGMASGRDGDKLAAAGFTAVRSELVDAPILQEFKLVLECRLFQVVELGLHTMFVGEVLDAKADAAVLDDKGRPVMDALRPLAFTPEVRTYHGLGPALGQAFHAGKALMPAKEPAKD